MMEKYVSVGQLKYYFAVDNTYVTKKLALLMFPFAHSDWSIRYNHDEPVQPRFELNAADLYIPSMTFVSYILVFCMYKYVGMIMCLVMGMFFSTSGYYVSLVYSAAALAIFLFRTLHLRVEPEVHGVESHGKRKIWLLASMVGWQPLVMLWLTYSLIPSYTPLTDG